MLLIEILRQSISDLIQTIGNFIQNTGAIFHQSAQAPAGNHRLRELDPGRSTTVFDRHTKFLRIRSGRLRR